MFLSSSSNVSFTCLPWVLLGVKVGVIMGDLRTMRLIYRVNVSETSGAGLPRLSQIMHCETGVVVIVKMSFGLKLKT